MANHGGGQIMAWEEWAQVKAEASARQTAQTRLNQLAPLDGGGVGMPELASSPEDKQAAARAINEEVEPGVRSGGKHVTDSMRTAIKEFGPRDGHGWDTSGALQKAQETWTKQVKMLLDRLAAEEHALARTGIDFRNNELDIAAKVARQSRIDGV